MSDDDMMARGKAVSESGKYAPTSGYTDHIPPPEPDEPYDIRGAQLLDDIRTFLARFVVYPSEHTLSAHTLWIAHTRLMDAGSPRPESRSCHRNPARQVTRPGSHRAAGTAADARRQHHTGLPVPQGVRPGWTADDPLRRDRHSVRAEGQGQRGGRGMLNAGHRKGAMAGRCVVRGKIVETEELPAYCAVALAGLDDLPDTIMTRSVIVRMRRRSPPSPSSRGGAGSTHPRPRSCAGDSRLGRTASPPRRSTHGRTCPPVSQDRAADVWEPLLAVAELVGGHWQTTARVAAVTVVTEAKTAAPSIGVLLLRDLRTVFNQLEIRNSVTDQLITNFKGIEDSPWAVIRKGEPLDARGLAQRLRKYGIEPKTIRDGDRVFKGYTRAQFEDAWSRYLEPLGPAAMASVTSLHRTHSGSQNRKTTHHDRPARRHAHRTDRASARRDEQSDADVSRQGISSTSNRKGSNDRNSRRPGAGRMPATSR